MPMSDPVQPQFKRRNPGLSWVLMFVTLGIYGLIWYYNVNREIAEAFPHRKVSPIGAVLAITLGGLVIVPPFVSVYNTGERIRNAQRDSGLEPTCQPWVGLLLSLLFGLHVVYYQIQLNTVADEPARLAAA
jgi:hypothetical protein